MAPRTPNKSQSTMPTDAIMEEDKEVIVDAEIMEEEGEEEAIIANNGEGDEEAISASNNGSQLQPRRYHYKYNNEQKAIIVRESVAVNAFNRVARKYGVQPNQLRHWRKNYKEICDAAMRNNKSLTIHKGRKLEYPELEVQLYNWFEQMHSQDIGVTTRQMVLECQDIEPSFKNGDQKKMERWIYCFMQRNRLSIRKITRVGQKLTGHLLEVQQDTVNAISNRLKPGGTLENIRPHYFLNMDQTAVFYESKPSKIVAKKGANTVSCRDSGSNARRCTVCVTVAADGTKLPPFFIFKGKPGARLEQGFLEQGIPACCQEKGWFNEAVVPKWFNLVVEPYIRSTNNGLLLVDHFKVHLGKSFSDNCAALGIQLEFIPPGYTCVLQPVDVGVNSQLKRKIRDFHMDWCKVEYKNVGNDKKLPLPTHLNIIDWVRKSYDLITEESIAKTFHSIGYRFPTPDGSNQFKTANDDDICNVDKEDEDICNVDEDSSDEEGNVINFDDNSVILPSIAEVLHQISDRNNVKSTNENTIGYRTTAFKDLAKELTSNK